MKKWYYLMLMAVLPLFAASLSSCGSDAGDVPQVEVSLVLQEGHGKVVGDIVYVVRGNSIIVNDLKVKNKEKGIAIIDRVTYFWDDFSVGYVQYAPYYQEFPTSVEHTKLDDHMISISSRVLAEGKSVGALAALFPVKVVETEDQIPAGGNTMITVAGDFSY